jgi:hypothetical protein
MTQQNPFQTPRLQRDLHPMLQPVEVRMILVAGNDVTSMREASMHLFRAGHMPVMGEWFSEPLVSHAGQDLAADEAVDEVVHPLNERLLARCDAVLRVGGPSASGDALVALARARALRVFFSLKDALDG